MPVTVINSNDQLKTFLKKNKKVVVAIASPGLAHCDGMKGEIETLSIKYPDIVFVLGRRR
ncbi:hypothetical protein J3458_013191 [Metarhizium acridum]|uniref:uncharacterized protein n=1 Tax=Metarhizium acridum TaxID=92637 RepID=UPI001C6CE781|nr:hypothetical protein J3458_013191 [Metarhizium acridum]